MHTLYDIIYTWHWYSPTRAQVPPHIWATDSWLQSSLVDTLRPRAQGGILEEKHWEFEGLFEGSYFQRWFLMGVWWFLWWFLDGFWCFFVLLWHWLMGFDGLRWFLMVFCDVFFGDWSRTMVSYKFCLKPIELHTGCSSGEIAESCYETILGHKLSKLRGGWIQIFSVSISSSSNLSHWTSYFFMHICWWNPVFHWFDRLHSQSFPENLQVFVGFPKSILVKRQGHGLMLHGAIKGHS